MNKKEKKETIETMKESSNFIAKTYSLIALGTVLPFIIIWIADL